MERLQKPLLLGVPYGIVCVLRLAGVEIPQAIPSLLVVPYTIGLIWLLVIAAKHVRRTALANQL